MSELKHGTKEYWMDWYWNRGGRDRVQAKRKINGFVGFKKKKWHEI